MTPDAYTIAETFLDVGDGHELYIHDWGNPMAKTPIIFLHGGPGSGVKDKYKQSFEPESQRVIFFDQRGCGKSLPFASLEHNTTADLVEDIEKIADHFKLSSFIITGGSWGSCLALAYAIKHPKRIESMVLGGIFTGTQAEIEWLNNGKFRTFFPDIWDNYLAQTPKSQASDPAKYHYQRMFSTDEHAAKESAYVYGNVEGALLGLDDRFTPPDPLEYDYRLSLLEAHYISHSCFIPDSYILDNAHKLTMPIWLVQGRYDMVCPPITAYKLNKKLPNSQLIWTVAGHGNDRANYDVMRTIRLQLTS